MELAREICDQMALGRSMNSICRELDIDVSCVRRWSMEDVDGCRAMFAEARQLQVHYWVDSIMDLCDDVRMDVDVILEKDENDEYTGEYEIRINHDHISRVKLKIDSMKWIAGKIAPKIYGDKVALEVAGPDGGPVQHQQLTRDELVQRARERGLPERIFT